MHFAITFDYRVLHNNEISQLVEFGLCSNILLVNVPEIALSRVRKCEYISVLYKIVAVPKAKMPNIGN